MQASFHDAPERIRALIITFSRGSRYLNATSPTRHHETKSQMARESTLAGGRRVKPISGTERVWSGLPSADQLGEFVEIDIAARDNADDRPVAGLA